MEILNILEKHLDFIVAVIGACFAWYTYVKEKNAKIIKKLAKEVIAFYCVEQEAIKMLKEKMAETSEQTIQRDLRKRALENENNLESVRPDMTANGARKLL